MFFKLGPAVIALMVGVLAPAVSSAAQAPVESPEAAAQRHVSMPQLPRLSMDVKPLSPLQRTALDLASLRSARQQPRRDSLRNGLLIGAVAGGIYGAVVVSLLHSELSGPSGAAGVILTSTGLGAGIGAVVDLLR